MYGAAKDIKNSQKIELWRYRTNHRSYGGYKLVGWQVYLARIWSNREEID